MAAAYHLVVVGKPVVVYYYTNGVHKGNTQKMETRNSNSPIAKLQTSNPPTATHRQPEKAVQQLP